MLKERVLNWIDPFLRLPVVGLDISDLTIKYLKFNCRKGKIDFDFFGELNLSEGFIEDGEIKNKTGVILALENWLEKEGRRALSCLAVVSLPEEKSFLRVIQLPQIKREEVANAVRWEIEANVPLAPEDLIYDYEIIEPLETRLDDHLDVVITAFPRVIVESYLEVLKEAGFRVSALELESQAIVRATISDLRKKDAKIVVDIGRSRTSLIIVAGGTIVFTTTIDVGGQNLEKNIMQSLGVSPEQAVSLKEKVGLNKVEDGGRIYASLLPTLSVLAEGLKMATSYYKDHTAHAHGDTQAIKKILLLGGDANLLGLDTFLSSYLKIPVDLADPFASVKNRLETPIPPMSKNQALKFGTASGLALRGLLKC